MPLPITNLLFFIQNVLWISQILVFLMKNCEDLKINNIFYNLVFQLNETLKMNNLIHIFVRMSIKIRNFSKMNVTNENIRIDESPSKNLNYHLT